MYLTNSNETATPCYTTNEELCPLCLGKRDSNGRLDIGCIACNMLGVSNDNIDQYSHSSNF